MKRVVWVLLASALAFTPLSAQNPNAGRAACDGSAAALRREVEAVNGGMIAALKNDARSVARYYLDDAAIMGGGMRAVGRAEIERYWGEGPSPADWKLEVLEVGGSCDSVWQRGLSTLTSASGRSMVTEFLAVLKRDESGRLRYYLDMYVAVRP